MSELHTCAEAVWERVPGTLYRECSRPCKRPATVWRDEQWYCRGHAQRKGAQAAWEARQKRERALGEARLRVAEAERVVLAAVKAYKANGTYLFPFGPLADLEAAEAALLALEVTG